MSKSIAAVLGTVLALVGFALGRFTGSAPVATEPEARGPAAAGSVSEALAEADPLARAARLATVLQDLGPDAASQAREILRRPQFDYGMAELELLMRVWARGEPKEATDWAFMAAPPGCPLASVTPSVEAWATQDPRATVEGIRTTLRGPDSNPAELGLVRGWFASGQPGLVEYIRDIGIGFERQRALGVFAALWIRRDGPEPVQRWAESLPDKDEVFKLDAFRQVATELAVVAPEAAKAWCDAHCDGPYGKNVRALIALHWAARDGKATMEWIATAPEGVEREYAVASAYEAWLRRDPKAAVAWANALGVDSVPAWFLPAVGRHVMALAREDPRQAVEWAPLIPNEENRERALITVFKHWRYRDEAAAEEWLARSPLSEEAREKARKRHPTELPSLAPKVDAKAPPA
jgi:hypothetical protein